MLERRQDVWIVTRRRRRRMPYRDVRVRRRSVRGTVGHRHRRAMVARRHHVRRGMGVRIGSGDGPVCWRGRRDGFRAQREPSRGSRDVLEPETAGLRDGGLLDFDALPSEDVLELIEVEGGHMALEEGDAAGDLSLETFGVSSGDEHLPVPVLLLARHARRRARRASWMFGVALMRN